MGSDGAGALVAAEARAGAVVEAEVLGGGEARGAEAAHEAAAVVARAVVGGHDAVAGDEGLAARGARRGGRADAGRGAVGARCAVEAPLLQDVARAERRVARGADKARAVEAHGACEERVVRDGLAAARADLERVRHAVALRAPQGTVRAEVLGERRAAQAAHKARVVVVRALRHRAISVFDRLLARGTHRQGRRLGRRRRGNVVDLDVADWGRALTFVLDRLWFRQSPVHNCHRLLDAWDSRRFL